MDTNLFSEGSIYYYENKSHTKKDYKNDYMNHDFVVSRPVYILDAKDVPFPVYNVNVLLITSSVNRAGIPINIDGFRNGKIIPYNIHALRKEYFVKYMGSVSDEMKQQVRQAVDYHMNRSDVKPQYLIEYEEKQKRMSDFLSHLSEKEASVYNLVSKRCLMKDIFYIDFDELFDFYLSKYHDDIHYEKSQNFSKALIKLTEFYPQLHYEIKNGRKIVHGLCINGKPLQRETNPNHEITKRNIFVDHSDKNTQYSDIEIENMQESELLVLLSEETLKLYQKLDQIQKINNWRCNDTGADLDIKDPYELKIVKKLISIEMTERKNKIFRKLDQGTSPFKLTSYEQCIIYKFTNKEITDHVESRLYQKGIKNFRHKLKSNMGYLMRKSRLK